MFKDLYDPKTKFMTGFVPMILRQYAMAHQWDDHDAGINNGDKLIRIGGPLSRSFRRMSRVIPYRVLGRAFNRISVMPRLTALSWIAAAREIPSPMLIVLIKACLTVTPLERPESYNG